jgi:hypothetical protein
MPKPPITLPIDEDRFWQKIREIVVPALSDMNITFPEHWILSREVPENFKYFMLDKFSEAIPSDEESYLAWCIAVQAIVRNLAQVPDEIKTEIYFDYPSCDAIPYLLISVNGKYDLISLEPSDWLGEYVETHEDLRKFLLDVAKAVSNFLGGGVVR